MKFLVHKRSGDVEVLLLPFKETTQHSFVNLTRGHICPCVFDSVEVALRDMESRKSRGLLDSYEAVDDNTPLTLDELRKEEDNIVYCIPLNDWAKVTKGGLLFFGTSNYCGWIDAIESYGETWLAYRRKPE